MQAALSPAVLWYETETTHFIRLLRPLGRFEPQPGETHDPSTTAAPRPVTARQPRERAPSQHPVLVPSPPRPNLAEAGREPAAHPPTRQRPAADHAGHREVRGALPHRQGPARAGLRRAPAPLLGGGRARLRRQRLAGRARGRVAAQPGWRRRHRLDVSAHAAEPQQPLEPGSELELGLDLNLTGTAAAGAAAAAAPASARHVHAEAALHRGRAAQRV